MRLTTRELINYEKAVKAKDGVVDIRRIIGENRAREDKLRQVSRRAIHVAKEGPFVTLAPKANYSTYLDKEAGGFRGTDAVEIEKDLFVALRYYPAGIYPTNMSPKFKLQIRSAEDKDTLDPNINNSGGLLLADGFSDIGPNSLRFGGRYPVEADGLMFEGLDSVLAIVEFLASSNPGNES